MFHCHRDKLFVFRIFTLLLPLSQTVECLQAQSSAAGRPYWWDNSGAVVKNASNNSAVAAVGQAMQMAVKAADAMESVYGARFAGGQYGLGADIHKVIDEFKENLRRNPTQTLANRALKLGQLKYISAPFWKRLQEFNAPGVRPSPERPFPWGNESKNDNALVTIGQVKQVFSFAIGPAFSGAGQNYQNILFNDLPEVTNKAESAYLLEEFDRPEAASSLGSAASSAVWKLSRFDGTTGGQTTLFRKPIQNLSVPYPAATLRRDGSTQPLVGGYLRLPPAFSTGQELSSLELTLTIPPGKGGGQPDQDDKYLYLQYRWRAFPDTSDGTYSSTPLSSGHQLPGAMVICERDPQDTQWLPYRALGWERFPALLSIPGTDGQQQIGACDMAFPVISPYHPNSHLGVDADGTFNLFYSGDFSSFFPQPPARAGGQPPSVWP